MILQQVGTQQKQEFLYQVSDYLDGVAPDSVVNAAKAAKSIKIPVGDHSSQHRQLLDQNKIDELVKRVSPYVLPALSEVRSNHQRFINKEYPGQPMGKWFDEVNSALSLGQSENLRDALVSTRALLKAFSPSTLRACKKSLDNGVPGDEVRTPKGLGAPHVSSFLTQSREVEETVETVSRPRV